MGAVFVAVNRLLRDAGLPVGAAAVCGPEDVMAGASNAVRWWARVASGFTSAWPSTPTCPRT